MKDIGWNAGGDSSRHLDGAFAEEIGAVYAAQDVFQSKILKLIEDYEAECARLRPLG